MATEVILPRVDMDMVDGKIAHWYVADGEAVKKGQLLFEIETDKATMEVDATADGVMHGIRGEIGVALPVGEVVGWILAPGEAAPGSDGATAADSAAAVVLAKEPASASAAVSSPPQTDDATVGSDGTGKLRQCASSEGRLLRATPLARSMAREQGIDLAAFNGSGPNGRILGADLASASGSGAPKGESPASKSAGVTAGATLPKASGAGLKAPSAASPAAVNLQWMRRGNGLPLVLIHGFGADHVSWRPLLQQLPDDFPVIGIDLPNHGKSAPLAVKTLQELAARLLDRLDEEGVIGFHLLGHSLGGGVALALTPMAEERARSLTLLAPVGLGVDINTGFIDGLVRAGDEAALRPVLAQLFHRPALLTGSFVATAFQQLQAPGRKAALTELAQQLMPRGRQSQNLRDLLATVRIPVQLVWGIEDCIIPMQQALDAPRHVGVHLLPAVGHLPHIEAAVWVGALTGHLRQSAAPM